MTDKQAILATSTGGLQSSAPLQTDVDAVPAVTKDFAITAQSQLQPQSQPQQPLAKKRSRVEGSYSAGIMGPIPPRTAKATGRVRKQVIRESKLSSTFDETELEPIYHEIVNDLQQQRSSKCTLSSTGMNSSSSSSSSSSKEEETKLWLHTNETKWKTLLQNKNISRAVWMSFWQKVTHKFDTIVVQVRRVETQEEPAPALTKEPSTLVVQGAMDDDWSFLVVGQGYDPSRLDFLQWDSLEPLP